ncbi:MAG: SRPBCC family protein [Sinimarinibacterium sp.]|jgi:uncharacterized protein YndB with AHSA1/START domain
MNTDRIEKQVLLRAPLARVWQAITDSAQFGAWFGVALDGPFVAGAKLGGRIVPTTVDAEVARMQEPHKGTAFTIEVDCIEPMHRFSFRWHPYAIEAGADHASEPMTLVEFTLVQTAGGVQLTISESGFDRIPLARRADAFQANEGGWAIQTTLIAKYLDQATQR